MMTNNDDLLTIKEAARAANISVGLLYRVWKSNEGPRRIKIGSRVLVHRDDLNKWIDELRERSDG